MNSPLRYAIIGTGGIANHHLRLVLERGEVEVVGLSDPSSSNLARAGARHPKAFRHSNAAVMLRKAEPDLVSVCTPNKFHCAMTFAALAAGAHVICEKPMAMNLGEARRMEAARRRARRLGFINFSYRSCASFRFARELIAGGELGTLRRVNVVYLQSFLGAAATRYSWRNDKTVAGFGALGDLGVHMIDAARFITGLEYRRAVGVAQTLMPTKRDASGTPRRVTTDTNAAFLTEFEGGVIGTFETSQVAPGYGNHLRLEISGARGTLAVLSSDDKQIWMCLGDSLSRYGSWTTSLPAVAVPSLFVDAQPPPTPAVFVDVLRGAKYDASTFEDGVRAQSVLEAILRSMKSGRWERV
ncbi:MAG: Gfo/Idh/MocA family oxidoreductase [Verrucomicrobiae bacterium]|nr:Gfo/Idh/MocA family oxidoreductase [Verrucomicrobiae bacterium]